MGTVLTDQVTDQAAGGQVTDQVKVDEVNNEPSADDAGSWTSALTDEFKGHELTKGTKNVNEFFKVAVGINDKLVQSETEMGALKTKVEGAIFKPGENATEEDIAAYRAALGVPEKAEDYKFTAAEGVEHSEKMLSWFASQAHAAGLNNEQAAQFVSAWDNMIQADQKATEEAAKAAITEATETLKKKWGAAYDEKVEFTRRGFDHFMRDNPEAKGFLDEGGQGNHPILIEMFNKVGESQGEDWSPPGKGGGTKDDPPGIKYDMPKFG